MICFSGVSSVSAGPCAGAPVAPALVAVFVESCTYLVLIIVVSCISHKENIISKRTQKVIHIYYYYIQ